MSDPHRKFLVEYRHEGLIYGSEVFAETWDQAEAMVSSLRTSAKVIGTGVVEIPLDKWLWAIGGFVVGLLFLLLVLMGRSIT